MNSTDNDAPDLGYMVAQTVIKLNGSDVSSDFYSIVTDVTVDRQMYLPDMFTIGIDNSDGTHWNDLKEGAEVEIGFGYVGGSTTTVVKGEITSVEPHFLNAAITLVARGYDKAHRLHHKRQTKSYVQMKDSDVATQIASDAGLTPDVDDTSGVHPYIFQNNKTDYEFLWERAHKNGYFVYVDGSTLSFKATKPEDSGAQLTASLGENLLEFHPRTTTVGQTNTVSVRAWDPQQKQVIVGQATTANNPHQIGDGKTGGDTSQSAHGISTDVLVARPAWDQSEAQEIAQSILDERNSTYISAEGLVLGDPKIKAGDYIQINGVGDRFSGKYLLTSCTHVMSPGGYTVQINVEGRGRATLSSLLHDDRPPEHLGSHPLVGIVTNNKDDGGDDTHKQGRIKVKFPTLSDTDESYWCRLLMPMAGNQRGFFVIPEVNDEVLVAFEHGDMHHPYIIGVLWNGQDAPPSYTTVSATDSSATVTPNNSTYPVGGDGKVNLRYLVTRTGHQILFDDTDDQGGITLVTKAGHALVMDDKNARLTLVDKTGSNILTIDSNANKLSINIGQDINVTAGGKIVMQATGQINMQSNDKIDVNGQQGVMVESLQNVDVQGQQGVSIASMQKATVEGQMGVDVQGMEVNLTGTATVSAMAPMIKLNS